MIRSHDANSSQIGRPIEEHFQQDAAPPAASCLESARKLRGNDPATLAMRAFYWLHAGSRGRFFVDIARAVRIKPDLWHGFERRLANLLPLLAVAYLRNATARRATEREIGVAAEFFLRLGMPEVTDALLAGAPIPGKALRLARQISARSFGLDLPAAARPRQMYDILSGLDLGNLLFESGTLREGLMWIGGPARLRKEAIDQLRTIPPERRKRRWLFDMTWEALELDRKGDPLETIRNFTNALSEIGIEPGDTVLLHANERLRLPNGQPVEETGGMRLLGRPFVMGLCSSVFRRERRRNGGLDTQVAAAQAALRQHKPHRFLCLNHISRPHRIMVVAKLAELQALDTSTVSMQPLAYNSHKRRRQHDRQGLASMSKEDAIDEALTTIHRANIPRGLLSTPRKTLEWLHDRLPLSLDIDVEGVGSRGKPLAWDFNPHHYLNTHISLVTETYFSEGSWLFITEKTCKAIYGVHPFVLAGDPGSLAQLRKHGFETFSPWIDESYDAAFTPGERMALILKEIERLSRLEPGDLRELTIALWPQVEHNYYHLMNDMPGMFKTFLDEALG